MNDNLPPLPESFCYKHDGTCWPDTFSAGQMKAYARAAIERQSVAPQPQPVQESEYCDPSSTIYKLAEMVMSDCGCSSDHQRLLDRIAARIQSHIDTTPQPAQPLPVQPTANSGDAEKAVLDRMAKYVSTITQSEIDEADGDRGITSPQAQPAKPLTKAQRAKVCVKAEAAMQRDQNLSWRDALINETEQAHGIPKGTT